MPLLDYGQSYKTVHFGQVLTITNHGTRFSPMLNDTTDCFKCGKKIGMRSHDTDGATGLAWYDPYAKGGGKYVHRECLSDRRKAEINERIKPTIKVNHN